MNTATPTLSFICSACDAELAPVPEKGMIPLLCPACEALCPPDLVAANHADADRMRAAIGTDGLGEAARALARSARQCVEAVKAVRA